MLLQTNSYIVPKDRKVEHARLIRRFRQTLMRLGCDHFEVYEQVGANWSNSESTGRYVQILRFTDRKHQLAVQSAERVDATAQAVIADFCELINFPYQQQQGLFAVGFYTSVLPIAPRRDGRRELITTVEHEDGDTTDSATSVDDDDDDDDDVADDDSDALVPDDADGDADAESTGPDFIDSETTQSVDLSEKNAETADDDIPPAPQEVVNDFLDAAEPHPNSIKHPR